MNSVRDEGEGGLGGQETGRTGLTVTSRQVWVQIVQSLEELWKRLGLEMAVGNYSCACVSPRPSTTFPNLRQRDGLFSRFPAFVCVFPPWIVSSGRQEAGRCLAGPPHTALGLPGGGAPWLLSGGLFLLPGAPPQLHTIPSAPPARGRGPSCGSRSHGAAVDHEPTQSTAEIALYT